MSLTPLAQFQVMLATEPDDEECDCEDLQRRLDEALAVLSDRNGALGLKAFRDWLQAQETAAERDVPPRPKEQAAYYEGLATGFSRAARELERRFGAIQ